MAKPDHTWIGSSCHIHGLFRDGEAAFTDDAIFGAARGLDRAHEGARGLPRAERELVQALRRRPGRRPRSPGARTTARAASASSVMGRRAASRPASRAATSTRTSPFAALIAAGLDGGNESRSRRRSSRAMRTSRTRRALPAHAAREAIAALEGSTFARGPSATTSSTTTSTTRTEQRLFDEVVTCYERETVRTWLSGTSDRQLRSRRARAVGRWRRRSSRRCTCTRSSVRASCAGRPAERGRTRGDARRARRLLFSGGNDLDPGSYGANPTRRRRRRVRSATVASWRCSRARSRGTCRCSPSAAAAGAERRARRRPRPAPARGRR